MRNETEVKENAIFRGKGNYGQRSVYCGRSVLWNIDFYHNTAMIAITLHIFFTELLQVLFPFICQVVWIIVYSAVFFDWQSNKWRHISSLVFIRHQELMNYPNVLLHFDAVWSTLQKWNPENWGILDNLPFQPFGHWFLERLPTCGLSRLMNYESFCEYEKIMALWKDNGSVNNVWSHLYFSDIAPD